MTAARDSEKKWRPATQLVRGGMNRTQFGETAESLFLNSGYCYDSPEEAEARFKGEAEGYVYSRFANPTVAAFEGRMALLEGTDVARATATGMAAVNASLMCYVSAGDHIVAAEALFGSCLYILEEIMPRFGVEVTLIDGTDNSAWEAAVRPNTKVLFLESPSNPTLDLVDLGFVGALAKKTGALFIIDNVFATPILQKPLDFGADVIVYSTTKHIDGQGRTLGGVICCTHDFNDTYLTPFMRHTGPSMSPFNAWVMMKGLETLPLRVEKHCANAEKIADFLEGHNKLGRVIYPGLKSHPQYDLAMTQQSGSGGPMIAFEVNGGKEGAFRFLNALEIIDISNNLGDAKSLITHPSTTTHQRLPKDQRAKLGITDGMLRMSVGLEDGDDLIEDMAHALESV